MHTMLCDFSAGRSYSLGNITQGFPYKGSGTPYAQLPGTANGWIW
jgi:hypothetical protein